MIPYLILIFGSFVASIVAVINKPNRGATLALGFNQKIRQQNLSIPVFFIIFFIMLACRHESIGVDLKVYKIHFESVMSMAFTQVLSINRDVLFYLFIWVVTRFTQSFQLFLAIVALVVLVPITKLYSEERENSFLKIVLFINLPVFILIFSGLRQAMAFAIGTIAYRYVREKKLHKFLLATVIALGFHHSGFIIVLFYPLYHLTLRRKHLLVLIPVMVAVFVFNDQVFLFATKLLEKVFGEDYSATVSSTGAYSMLILFILLAVFAYVIPDEQMMDAETVGLRNFLLMAVLLQCFAPVHTLAMRMNYYFILYIPILIPKVIKYCKKPLYQVGLLGNTVLSTYLLVYYLEKLYTSCSTGVSSLGTYPYLPFWK